jgi:hypothetical protein
VAAQLVASQEGLSSMNLVQFVSWHDRYSDDNKLQLISGVVTLTRSGSELGACAVQPHTARRIQVERLIARLNRRL